jgi:hypothetical protein
MVMKSSVFWNISSSSPLKVNDVSEDSARNSEEAGGKQRNRLAEISDCIGNRRGTEDSKSVPLGSPVGQNEPASTHWLSHKFERNNKRQEYMLGLFFGFEDRGDIFLRNFD